MIYIFPEVQGQIYFTYLLVVNQQRKYVPATYQLMLRNIVDYKLCQNIKIKFLIN